MHLLRLPLLRLRLRLRGLLLPQREGAGCLTQQLTATGRGYDGPTDTTPTTLRLTLRHRVTRTCTCCWCWCCNNCACMSAAPLDMAVAEPAHILPQPHAPAERAQQRGFIRCIRFVRFIQRSVRHGTVEWHQDGQDNRRLNGRPARPRTPPASHTRLGIQWTSLDRGAVLRTLRRDAEMHAPPGIAPPKEPPQQALIRASIFELRCANCHVKFACAARQGNEHSSRRARVWWSGHVGGLQCWVRASWDARSHLHHADLLLEGRHVLGAVLARVRLVLPRLPLT